MQFTHLIITEVSLIVMYSRSDLQSSHLILWSLSVRLSARLDRKLFINFILSTNFVLYVIVLMFSVSFLIGSQNVMYFSVFSPRYLNRPLNSTANSLIIK